MADHEEEHAAEPSEADEPAATADAPSAELAGSDPNAEGLVQKRQETTGAVGEISPEMGAIKADPGAGGSRFDELVGKRKSIGLSDEESEELGRLMAQRDGREWTSTREMRTHPADSA